METLLRQIRHQLDDLFIEHAALGLKLAETQKSVAKLEERAAEIQRECLEAKRASEAAINRKDD